MLLDTEIAWLAGLLEGEGSFMVNGSTASNGVYYEYPRIVVSMTDRDVVARAAELFGTSVYEVPNRRKDRKNAFRATATGQNALVWMRRVLPYMGARRAEKIREILAVEAQRPDPNVSRREWSQNAAKSRVRDSRGVFVGGL